LKILAVIGSPRKGHTYQLVQQIELELRLADPATILEYVFLKETNLEMCRGCFLCVAKGEKLCPIKDDFSRLEEQLQAADGVILASPVYCFNVSSLMKNFIDRMSYVCHRPSYFGKYALVVTTSGGGGIPDVLKYLESMANTWGFACVDKLGVMNHPGTAPSSKTATKIKAAAQKFHLAVKNKEVYSPKFTSIIQFRIMKLNSQASALHFPADHEYYQDKKGYFIKVRLNPLKNAAAKVMEKIFVLLMERMA